MPHGLVAVSRQQRRFGPWRSVGTPAASLAAIPRSSHNVAEQLIRRLCGIAGAPFRMRPASDTGKQARLPMAHIVFTSYAQRDRDRYLERFVEEFREELQGIVVGRDPDELT